MKPSLPIALAILTLSFLPASATPPSTEAARRSSAVKYVQAHGYHDDRFAREWPRFRDRWALRTLMDAGFDAPSAAAKLAEIKRAALAVHFDPGPGFHQSSADIRTQLRSSPAGHFKNRGVKKSHNSLRK